ncbi:hypothetical protein CRUP_024170 [Coryphaenoides rupestris]|nr:hypothetical protein CRUP_024170 [Coryphaenoides rupestris]
MDISTGHMILAYMEDHLKNKDRLEREWEALCSYQAEPSAAAAGLSHANAKKNRSCAAVAYDHSRIRLKAESSQGNSDYINASPIVSSSHSPRHLITSPSRTTSPSHPARWVTAPFSEVSSWGRVGDGANTGQDFLKLGLSSAIGGIQHDDV